MLFCSAWSGQWESNNCFYSSPLQKPDVFTESASFFLEGLASICWLFLFFTKICGAESGAIWGQLGGRLGGGSNLTTQCSSGPHGLGAVACCSPVGLLDGLRGGICQLCPLALHLMLVHSERVHVLAVAHEHLQLPLCELPGLHADKSVPQLV